MLMVSVEQMPDWIMTIDLEYDSRYLLPQTAMMLIYLHDVSHEGLVYYLFKLFAADVPALQLLLCQI